ncbi:hypothetical protein ALP29_02076 [Pseudomonas syringae pv. avii]|uniref:Uncharacterized protein n=2 Tax=Pseudomonas syringae TaxID=317 RepID=A0A3M5V2N2_PSESX|nr:hypothetical protein ALP29_02076 [Pseudomonas syringae pv. avii]
MLVILGLAGPHTAATHHLQVMLVVLTSHQRFTMIKDSPNPPSDSQPTDQIFTILTNLNSETLLANASQDLASVQSLAGQLAFDVDGSLRDAVLGIHRMVEGIQLMVDRVLDLHEVSAATAN